MQRSYWYARGDYEYDDVPMADAPDGTCPDTGHDSSDSCKSPCPPLDMPLSCRNWIDYAHTDASADPQVINSIGIGEGDGTVSLWSLGAMCVERGRGRGKTQRELRSSRLR
jgi:phospholipid:diacylglycerol acyltransferase